MKIRLFLLFLALLSVTRGESAQQFPVSTLSDSVNVFRFIPCRDVFYTYLGRNKVELDSILSLVKRHHEAILSGRVVVCVDSYCTSLPTEKENLDLALLRAKEVERAITWRKRLMDCHFVVRVHATPREDMEEVVIVRLVPATGADVEQNPDLSFVTRSSEKGVTRDLFSGWRVGAVLDVLHEGTSLVVES